VRRLEMLAFLRGPFNVIVLVNGRAVGAYKTTNLRQARSWFYDGIAFNG
jgi:hypothetical protein